MCRASDLLSAPLLTDSMLTSAMRTAEGGHTPAQVTGRPTRWILLALALPLAIAVPLAVVLLGTSDADKSHPVKLPAFVQELTSSLDLNAVNVVVPTCPSQPPALDVGPDWTPLDEPAYKTLAVERLAGAIRAVSISPDRHLDRSLCD